MKLVRFGESGNERPGIVDAEGQIRDLTGEVDDIGGLVLGDESLDRLRRLNPTMLPKVPVGMRLGPCLAGIGKFMCIGLNYSDHAAETGNPIPQHPILFMKATSAVVGPNDTVSLPRGSTTSDWEVELGVIIGKKAKYLKAANALDHVAGYCVVNDVSERTFQSKLSGQWTKGKSCDTFGPIGPWLVTRDEVADPQELDLDLELNGRRIQTGNTRNMIFSVAEIIEHLSQIMTLHPGDIIATGTPPGVGMSIKPEPIFLKPGDVMDLGITGLGRQRQNVIRDS